MTKVSIIMPVYNTKEEFLREAIESILSQSFEDFEFIIINDGSTNNAEEVILSYNDARIRYEKQENMGVAQTLNNALKLASGELIARMDADDVSNPDRLQVQVEFMNKHKDISVCGSSIEIFNKDKSRIKSYIEYPKALDLYYGTCFAHPVVIFRKKDFEKYNLKYNPDFKCEDYDLWSRAIQNLKFYNIQKPLLRYRLHGNNITMTNTSAINNDARRVSENILNFLTSDEKIKQLLRGSVKPKVKPLQFIFSIKNINATKTLIILGIKIPIKGVYH